MLTLTPNRRLAAFLIREHNNAQIAAGNTIWDTPQILHLKGWFTQLWQVCGEALSNDATVSCLPLLNDLQQQLVWEEIIRTSSTGVELLRIAATAKNTIQAWKFLRQWAVSVDKLAAYAQFSTDTQAFYTWLQSYLQWLRNNKYLDYDLMLDELTVHLPKFAAQLPREICLMGVEELTPQQAKFFKLLPEYGITIQEKSVLQQPQQTQLHNFANKQNELEVAAYWAQQIIATDKNKILAVVVPNLEIHRREVVRIFNSIIPAAQMNISAPASLSNFSLVEHALLILQMCRGTFGFADFSRLLRSPYVKNVVAEMDLRSRIDRALRDCVEAKLTWYTLEKNLYNIAVKSDLSSPTINELITNSRAMLELTVDNHLPSGWAKIFHKILNYWGWPGTRDMIKSEIDLVTCWQDLLDNFSKLDIMGQALNFNDALQFLLRLAKETPFLPAETGATRLHILGVLEAAGICFDALWVTGMDRDNWPPHADPNPFIPGELQRQFDLPRSSPQRELKVARRLTANLCLGGKAEVHFSYAAVVDDHDTAVSNLLAHIPQTQFNSNAAITAWQTTELEALIDSDAPPYTAQQVKGGTRALQLQAQCPFKAFAELRLQAKKLETPQLILNAAERGKIVHAILEQFWLKCKTQAQLFAWLPNILQKTLEEIVANILASWQQQFPLTLNDNYVKLEKQRLQQLLRKWLEYELERAPFTVTAVEEKIQVTVGGLRFAVRADRIDTLTSGDIVIIDYKTGVTNVADWFRESIVEPQMPLYALATQDQIAAIVYANIVSQHDRIKFTGIASSAVVPDVKVHSDWDLLLNDWRSKLHDCAIAFAGGVATVQPYNDQVCKRCNLQALCRIYDS